MGWLSIQVLAWQLEGELLERMPDLHEAREHVVKALRDGGKL